MNEFKNLTNKLLQFRDERDWAQFHNAKDLSLAISIEAAELIELFLWKDPSAADPDKIKDELADIFSFALLLAHHQKLDVNEIVADKILKNAAKYPVDKAKGKATKYDQF
jgi:NTP pyrophosphatase (non-canonical NTP hydrolase)